MLKYTLIYRITLSSRIDQLFSLLIFSCSLAFCIKIDRFVYCVLFVAKLHAFTLCIQTRIVHCNGFLINNSSTTKNALVSKMLFHWISRSLHINTRAKSQQKLVAHVTFGVSAFASIVSIPQSDSSRGLAWTCQN